MESAEIQNVIKGILENMNLTVSAIEVSQPEGSTTTWYNVMVSDPHFFTTRDGEALHALNHLVKRLVEVKNTEESGILIDIGDFQKKRVDSIKAIAHMIAERARYFKSNVEVDPMSAFDRRIVHEYVSNSTDLQSESICMGKDRLLVIKYIGTI